MLTYEDYEQISDTLGWLDSSIQYKFVTKLATKDKYGNREFFHKEYNYRTSAYNNVDMVTSIKRSFDYYIVLENIREKDTYIQIRPQNMIMLQTVLSTVINWIFDDKLWGVKNKCLVLKGKPQPLYMQSLPMDKWLSFELIVIEYNGQFDKGVRIVLSDESKYADVRVDQFMAFAYTMQTFNMYLAAMEMVNYLRRPAFGTNMVTFDAPPKVYNNTNNQANEGVESKGTRIIEPPQKQKQKSFFDKINSISD